MISIIIIEDDPISADLLADTLRELRTDIDIRKILGSVSNAVDYLKNNNSIHLIFSDIQLPDGLSFSIFEQVKVHCPIVFVSAYDKYMVNVFDYCGIDYLLKPISHRDIIMALAKYTTLEKHFTQPLNQGIQEFLKTKKTRTIVRKGNMLVSLPLSEVVLFYTENMVVYVYDNSGHKYMIDKSLNVLEEELDPQNFMRVNRQYILNVKYVYGYRIHDRVKLLVILTVKEMSNMIIVGQEKTRMFKEWISEA